MDTAQVLEQLRREHHELDDRVALLERKSWLTADEDTELHQLKKLKLAKRDRIEELARVARAT